MGFANEFCEAEQAPGHHCRRIPDDPLRSRRGGDGLRAPILRRHDGKRRNLRLRSGRIAVLIMRKWAATLAIVCLAVDVVGRVAMVFTGLYPVDSPAQTFAIITGTAIVVAFAIYILSKWRAFE
jgi:hypothetical protein